MFKGLGTWLGLENLAQTKTQEDAEEQNVVQEVKEEAEKTEENNKHPAEVQRRTEAEQDNHDPGKGLSGKPGILQHLLAKTTGFGLYCLWGE